MLFLSRSHFFVIFFAFSVILPKTSAIAQLSPPGLDNTHVVIWGAVGIINPSEKNGLINPMLVAPGLVIQTITKY